MGHSRELLDRIAADVAATWPPARGYRVEFERPLPGVRGMLPDIQVVDSAGKVHCVVEIGYTRPEKLTHYRASGIEDVRWYDKAGNLHEGPVLRTVVVQRTEAVPSPAEAAFKQVDIYGVECVGCVEGFIESYCGAHFDLSDALGDVADEADGEADGEDDGCDCSPRRKLTDKQFEIAHEAALEEFYDTRLTVVSNGYRWIGLFFCDHCGESGILSSPEDLRRTTGFEDPWDVEAAYLEHAHKAALGPNSDIQRITLRRFESDPLNAHALTLAQVMEMALEHFELAVEYSDFSPWPRRGAWQ